MIRRVRFEWFCALELSCEYRSNHSLRCDSNFIPYVSNSYTNYFNSSRLQQTFILQYGFKFFGIYVAADRFAIAKDKQWCTP